MKLRVDTELLRFKLFNADMKLKELIKRLG